MDNQVNKVYTLCLQSNLHLPTLSFSPPGDIPVVPLNFVMISLEGPFNRDTIEGCVKETLLFLSRSISVKQNVEFTFKGIGVLSIRDSKVKMRFYKDFLCSMDGSGTLSNALANVSRLLLSFPGFVFCCYKIAWQKATEKGLCQLALLGDCPSE